MRYLILSILFSLVLYPATLQAQDSTDAEGIVAYTDFPPSKGWVNDYGKLLTEEEIDTLTQMIKAHEEKTTNEIAILTIGNIPEQYHYDLKAYGEDLANKWGIGKADKNNGILISICVPYRRIAINTGLGMEDKISDSFANNIITRYMSPYFMKRGYYPGLKAGLEAIIRQLEEGTTK